MNAPKKIWAIPAIGGGWGDDMGMWRKSSTKIEGQAEYTRSDLCALAAPQPDAQTRVTVKPLVWVDGGTNRFVAQTPFGEYLVAKINGSWRWFFSAVFDCEDRTFKGKGVDEVGCKTAAQADYATRIRSAIGEPSL